jgi:hypothetical protein
MPLNKAKLNKGDRLYLLHQFQNKARCMHTQRRATSLWKRLVPFLDGYFSGRISFHNCLSTAWTHFQMGEGPEELDDYCNELMEIWRKELKLRDNRLPDHFDPGSG